MVVRNITTLRVVSVVRGKYYPGKYRVQRY